MKIFSISGLVLLMLVTSANSFGNSTFSIPRILEVLETSSDVDELCMKHLNDYLKGINSSAIWAMQMFDSSTKFPDGLFLGRSNFPGHFDECVEVTGENFQGKHCMVNVKFQNEKENFLIPRNIPPQLMEHNFELGLCVPSTCSARDVENAIKNIEELNFLKVELQENDCSTKGFRPLRTEDWITLCVIGGIALIALLSTAYDLYQRFVVKTENPSQLWTSFSIYATGKQLFRISQSSSQLKCLHGIRFLSMCWVILAHCYISFLSTSSLNLVEIPKIMNDKSFTPVSNGFVSVDSFFFLSGLLVCLVFFRDISKKGSFDVPVAFLHRYLRLTPPFAILILIQATIISRIGNGPFWNTRIDTIENFCRDSWWSGILYVQNYINPMAMCLGQAWYLSADMQMYWISPLILYPMLWFPSFAPYFVGLLVLVAALTNFTIAYVNKLQPSVLMQLNSNVENQFRLEYCPFHTRMAPWLIGLATGYIICGIQAKKINIRMPKLWVICGWLVTFGILGGTVFGFIRFIPDDIFQSDSDYYTTTEAALYLAFHRVGWALGLAWVVIACISGYGGPINQFLSLDFFQPLAKLSYCNFLIHMTLQQYRIFTSRTNQYLRHFEVVYAYFADLFISHLISIPIVLLFEFPFTNLDRHFLQKLVILPLPKRKLPEKKIETEKVEKTDEVSKDIETGKENRAYENDT